jgi:hypothetical protein
MRSRGSRRSVAHAAELGVSAYKEAHPGVVKNLGPRTTSRSNDAVPGFAVDEMKSDVTVTDLHAFGDAVNNLVRNVSPGRTCR